MNKEELLEKIKEAENSLEIIRSIYKRQKVEEQIKSIKKETESPDFWKKNESSQIMERLTNLTNVKDNLKLLQDKVEEVYQLLELFRNEEKELQCKELSADVKTIEKLTTSLKNKLLLSGPYDQNPCFLSIVPGAGGTESQDWASMLLRMYIRFCERNNYKYKVLDLQNADEAGIKSVTLAINGNNAYGLLKAESGIHRLVRISPFDSNKRRHTSFASVMVTPEVPETTISIKPDEIKIDTFRSGGAGGQHVNTTDSAVRITHIPTGIIVQCQNERSQIQNRQQAMKMLVAKLTELEEQKRKQTQNEAQEKKKIEWGSQIRSYVLHPYKMVKDHRTKIESPRPELVLNGELEEFINGYLEQYGQANKNESPD